MGVKELHSVHASLDSVVLVPLISSVDTQYDTTCSCRIVSVMQSAIARHTVSEILLHKCVKPRMQHEMRCDWITFHKEHKAVHVRPVIERQEITMGVETSLRLLVSGPFPTLKSLTDTEALRMSSDYRAEASGVVKLADKAEVGKGMISRYTAYGGGTCGNWPLQIFTPKPCRTIK